MELIVLSDSFGVFVKTKEGIKRLEGFSKFDFNAGGECYTRQYFSAPGKHNDVINAYPEIGYTFDRMKNNAVHDLLSEISDMGLTGKEAEKEFVFVDFTSEADGKYRAIRQRYIVKCTDRRPENGFLDYSGKLIAKGNIKKGFAVLSEDLKSGEFLEERSGILCD